MMSLLLQVGLDYHVESTRVCMLNEQRCVLVSSYVNVMTISRAWLKLP